jgi:toxin YoeB
MARKIIWTLRAINDKKHIFDYWSDNNKSNMYAVKLDKLFNEAVELLAVFPFTGTKTQIKNVRVQFVENFKLIYKVFDTKIYIITIWDMHRNPKNLKL